MCGRTACTLAPDDIIRACQFRDRHGRRQNPIWKDPPGGQQYYPSHNIAPASHTPVLISSKHYPGELDSISERVVQPMKWGLVPPWHNGDPYKIPYETNNCRSEGMLTKRTYKVPLEKGQRCVVLADGFFEWKTTKDKKQPYFIYFPQSVEDCKSHIQLNLDQGNSSDIKPIVKLENIKPDPDQEGLSDIKTGIKSECNKPDPDSRAVSETTFENSDPDSCFSANIKQEPETEESIDCKAQQQKSRDENLLHSSTQLKTSVKSEESEDDVAKHLEKETNNQTEKEWHGRRLLTMAGVFDVWQPPDGSPPLYSYSVITGDASPAMAWIHHRMPALLTTEEEIRDWLEFSEVPLNKAVKHIRSTECIQMHMVSPIVNNSRNKSPECVEPYEPKQVKKCSSSNLMMNWLQKGKTSTHGDSPEAKKPKLN